MYRIAAVVAWSMAFPCLGAAEERAQLRLPPIGRAPVIDGVISPGEWDTAFRGTGFVRHAPPGVVDPVRVEYWFAYDAEHLYFAVRQETGPDGKVRGRKRRTRNWHDEHIEILIDPNPLNPDQTRFHFMGNAYDSIQELGHNDRLGGFVPFNGDWTVANRVQDGWWVQEMKTSADALGKARLRMGDTWGLFIGACCDGPHYFGWPQAAFLQRHKYLLATLDPAAPVVRVEDLGPWEAGTVAPKLAIANPHAAPQKLALTLLLSDPKREVARHQAEVNVAPGQVAVVAWSHPLPPELPAGLDIRLTSPDGKTVFFYGPYAFGPAREPKWPPQPPETEAPVKFASYFYPGFSRLKNTVDFSAWDQASQVMRLTVVVHAPDGRQIASGDLDRFEEGAGWFTLQLPRDLAPGPYRVTARLMAGDQPLGEPLADRFEKKTFPFEGNRLGLADIVPSPWTPLKTNPADATLECWGRLHTLGPDGLPRQITTRGRAVLAEPVSLRVRQADGQWVPLAGKGLTFTKTTPSAVEAQAAAEGPGLRVKVSLHAEYDGMLQYTLGLEPVAEGRIGGLDLVIPMKADHAWLMHATSDGCRTNASQYISAGDGRVWDSTRLMNWALTGSFIPQVWLGDDERGLAWWADSEAGWVRPASRKEPAIEIRRHAQTVALVLHLVARPFQLTKPRTLVFALTATPMRPKASWARSITSGSPEKTGLKGPFIHWYGSTCWALMGGDKYKDWPYIFTHLRPVSDEAAAWLKQALAKVHQAGRIALAYTDQRARSAFPEAQYYAWEWNPQMDDPAKAAVEALKPYQAVAINTAPSRLDHDLWCLSQTMDLGMDAWYFDEVQAEGQLNPTADLGFQDDDGSWQPVSRLFGLRQFLKRLYVMMQERGHKEPLIVIHNTSTTYAGPFAFATALFDMEAINTDPRRRHLTMYGLEYLMAESMGHQWGLVGTCLGGKFEGWVTWDRHLGDPRLSRHWVGVHWLLDMRPYLYQNYDIARADRIMADFGYQDPQCRWVPFWRAGDLQTVSPEACKVSLYRNGSEVMLVILNDGPEDAVVRWKPSERFGLVGTPSDPERDGEYLPAWIYRKPDGTWHFFVQAYDYRFIRVAANGRW